MFKIKEYVMYFVRHVAQFSFAHSFKHFESCQQCRARLYIVV